MTLLDEIESKRILFAEGLSQRDYARMIKQRDEAIERMVRVIRELVKYIRVSERAIPYPSVRRRHKEQILSPDAKELLDG